MRLVEGAYKAAVGAKWVTPADFWSLTPEEFWWLLDAHTPEKTFGKKRRLTQSDVERIARDLER